MNKKEIIIKVLEEMGYRPHVDNDNDIMFTFQLKTLYFSIIDDDEPDQNIVLGGFYDFDEQEAVKMLIICNKINREIRHIKVVVNEEMNTVSAMYQFVLTDETAARENIRRAFDLFGCIRSYFAQEVDRMSQEDGDETENNDTEG